MFAQQVFQLIDGHRSTKQVTLDLVAADHGWPGRMSLDPPRLQQPLAFPGCARFTIVRTMVEAFWSVDTDWTKQRLILSSLMGKA